MNVYISMRQAQYILAALSGCFLLIHVAMLVLFTLCGVTPMVWFNVFSILFYLGSFVLVQKRAIALYSTLMYVEVVAHMVAAIACVGWGAGFQITLVGMSILAYFMEYLGRSLSARHASGAALSLAGAIAYVAVFEYTTYYHAPYQLPTEVCFWLQVSWAIVVFFITISILQIFLTVTFESEKLLRLKVGRDKLTELPNRYRMADYLQGLESGGKLAGHWIAIADIDDFKKVNDTFGHNCGDYVLKEVAGILAKGTEDSELCRWGGEEFLIVGSTAGDLEARVSELDGLRKSVESHDFWYEEAHLRITITMGVELYEEGLSIKEWVSQADKKLYEGKGAGKNRVVV